VGTEDPGPDGSGLTVLVNAGPWLPVPCSSGGVEAVLAGLIPALRERGVKVVLASLAASTVEADELIHVFDDRQHHRMGMAYTRTHTIAHAHMDLVLERAAAGDIDLVHDHLEIVGAAMLGAAGRTVPPALHTLHWNHQKDTDGYSRWYERFDGRGRVLFSTRSEQQRAALPDHLARQVLATVPNGVSVPPYPDAPVRNGPLLCLGDLSHARYQQFFAPACAELGIELEMAGPLCGATSAQESAAMKASGVLDNHPAYRWYLDHVAPHEGEHVRWIGVVGGQEKWARIRRAPALLSGLGHGMAVTEALMLGVPVIAPRPAPGAMTQVEHGVNGWFFDPGDVGSFAGAVAQAHEIDPAECRASAADRTVDAMAQGYIRAYRRLLERAGQHAPAVYQPSCDHG